MMSEEAPGEDGVDGPPLLSVPTIIPPPPQSPPLAAPLQPDGPDGAAAAAPSDTRPTEPVKVIARGYLLKRSRSESQSGALSAKPWKKRFFVLHGATLLYYRQENMAGAHKVLVTLTLTDGCEVDTLSEPPWNAKASLPFVIRQDGEEFALAVAGDAAERIYWITMLRKARMMKPPQLTDQSSKFASSSTTLRLKVGLSAALASSSIGRAIVKRYLDADSRELIAALLVFASAERSPKKVRAMEKGAFDAMARLGVIVHAGKIPPHLDLTLLYDETVNFCHDFLAHCRDQRLKAVRGPDAEVIPINGPELLRSLGVVTEMWKDILMPHSSTRVLATFDDICAVYCREERILALLLEAAHVTTRDRVETSLRGVMERY
eukprot:m.213297 g.213297  ORF g.213297 m.213297 type:complete len:377 (-) comp25555_c0_seq1:1547-2677(-)